MSPVQSGTNSSHALPEEHGRDSHSLNAAVNSGLSSLLLFWLLSAAMTRGTAAVTENRLRQFPAALASVFKRLCFNDVRGHNDMLLLLTVAEEE